jgi:hypothetical protein
MVLRPEPPLEEISFQEICGDASSVMDVIFVHGLTGDPLETWTTSGSDPALFWPKWLHEDNPALRILTLGYPSTMLTKWGKGELNIYECAKASLELMAAKSIGDRPIAFVAHSLGGILSKQILRAASEGQNAAWKAIAKQTKAVFFLATPHTGAGLASAFKFVIPRLSSSHMETLTNSTGALTDLNEAYRLLADGGGIQTQPYYETQPLKGPLVIVSKECADPGIPGCAPIPLEADHISICKPSSKDSLLYNSLRLRLKTLAAAHQPASAVSDDDYSEPSESDRRDLLQKLIAANMEHMYRSANESQNKFAQRYHKLGLHTEARIHSDRLLSEVEQRFNLHVYSQKIQKGAAEAEIMKAVQRDVVDPICAKDANVRAGQVIRALYFLTEQCHLRWDAE